MTRHALVAILGVALLGADANAQVIHGAVLAKAEPHHHPVYEDAAIRVLRVHVPRHDTTLLHEHDPDYFWIALGASRVVSARLGAPDATIISADLSIHYTPGNFAHVARNPGDASFDNITVELLGSQTNPRNLCEAAIAARPIDCASDATLSPGVTAHPAFSTDQLRVDLVTIAPGAVLQSARKTIIALDTVDVARGLSTVGARWVGGVLRSGGTARRIQNR